MNLVSFEIKSALRSSIIWVVSLVALFALLMLSVYPLYSDAVDEVTAIMDNFPPEFAAIFGMHLADIFSYGGFYNFAFLYLALVAAIMASSLSMAVFAREKRSKSLDFLLTKPVSRQGIFMKKLLSCFIIITGTNVIYVLCGVFMYWADGEKAYSMGTYILALLGLYFTQIVFMAFGIAYATFARKVRSVSGAATAFGFGAFILSAITNLMEDKNLDFLAPLKYFQPMEVLDHGAYKVALILAAVVVVGACIGASYAKFSKNDIPAV